MKVRETQEKRGRGMGGATQGGGQMTEGGERKNKKFESYGVRIMINVKII